MIDFEKYSKSLLHLEAQYQNYLHLNERDSITKLDEEGIKESVIQRFETCYDSVWKALKRYLNEELGLAELPNSPKPIFMIAYENNLLKSNIIQWKLYADIRVGTAHDYSSDKVDEALLIMGDFISDANHLLITISKK
jgi:hypothetical protein